MRKITYIGIFWPTDGGLRVSFEDLPGCTCTGQTFEKAHELAAQALALHLYGLEKSGMPLPRPGAITNPPPGTFAAPVIVYPDMVRMELDNRRVKTNVTLPAWLKAQAELHRINYSKVLEAALMDILNPHKR